VVVSRIAGVETVEEVDTNPTWSVNWELEDTDYHDLPSRARQGRVRIERAIYESLTLHHYFSRVVSPNFFKLGAYRSLVACPAIVLRLQDQ
jgi:hypothetical protein